MKTILDEYLEDEEFRRLFAQEDLILEVTETLCELLEREKVSRKELADRLGKTKGFISQLLGGGRNLTLRTVADILHVLGYKVSLKAKKLEKQRRNTNVFEFPASRMIYQATKKFKSIHHSELEDFSKADNYPVKKYPVRKALSG